MRVIVSGQMGVTREAMFEHFRFEASHAAPPLNAWSLYCPISFGSAGFAAFPFISPLQHLWWLFLDRLASSGCSCWLALGFVHDESENQAHVYILRLTLSGADFLGCDFRKSTAAGQLQSSSHLHFTSCTSFLPAPPKCDFHHSIYVMFPLGQKLLYVPILQHRQVLSAILASQQKN